MDFLCGIFLAGEWEVELIDRPDDFFECSSSILLAGQDQLITSTIQYSPVGLRIALIQSHQNSIDDFINELNNNIAGQIRRTFESEDLSIGQSLPVSYLSYYTYLNQKIEQSSRTEGEQWFKIKKSDFHIYWQVSFRPHNLPQEDYALPEDDDEIDFL